MQTDERVSNLTPRYRVFLFGQIRLEQEAADSTACEPSYIPFVPDCWNRQSPWRVLTYLLTCGDRQTYKDPLLDALWPDAPLERSRLACSIALSQVRHGLLDHQGQALVTPRKADEQKLIHLAGQEQIWCDWHAFSDVLTQAQLAENYGGDALTLWEKAYALSRKEFLLAERYHDWCRSLRERTEGDQRLCVLHLTACYGTHGRSADEERLLRQFLSDHPRDEDILCRLVNLLAQQGRSQEAVRWYQRTLEALEEEGLEATEQMREVGKHLQKRHHLSTPSFPFSITQDIIRERVLPQPLPPESSALTSVFDRATQFMVTIFGLVNQWQGRATHCNDLQVLLSQEFAMFDQDTSQPNAGEQNALSRRQALVAIAALPYGALAAARHAGTGMQPEAFLPQCTAAITSCWSMMQGREFAVVEQALAHCLPALTTLSQQSSPYQQAAAGLAAQGNLLLGLVALHQQPAPQNFRQRVLHCKQAVTQAEHISDPTLLILSLIHVGATEGDLEHFPAMLAANEEAVRLSNHELVSSTLRRKAFAELAWSYARAGQAQQALQYYGEVSTSLPSASDQVPAYLQDSGLFFEGLTEAQMFEKLGKLENGKGSYKRAWKTMEQAESLLPSLVVPERFRVEAVNQKALIALRLGYLDQFRDLSLQGLQGAKDLKSEKRRQEVIANWKEARKVWPREPQVMDLADVLLG
ncbi:MAG: bacterial transcriptional activator domain-containing protein [Ktedonobacteraceae bacterium]